jgi:hypothetical protein
MEGEDQVQVKKLVGLLKAKEIVLQKRVINCFQDILISPK